MFVFEGYIVHEWERAGHGVQEEDAAGMFRVQPQNSRCRREAEGESEDVRFDGCRNPQKRPRTGGG